jgi:hypothetical protein
MKNTNQKMEEIYNKVLESNLLFIEKTDKLLNELKNISDNKNQISLKRKLIYDFIYNMKNEIIFNPFDGECFSDLLSKIYTQEPFFDGIGVPSQSN